MQVLLGKIYDALSAPVINEGRSLFISVSAGYALYNRDGVEAEGPLKKSRSREVCRDEKR